MSATMPATERGLRLAVSPITRVTVRDATGTGDGSWTIEGYAAVYEQETVLYDGSWFRMREEIARGAFTSVLDRVGNGLELVHLNFGHDMNTSIAATDVRANEIGGLELEEDFHGLRFFARVDAQDPDAIRLAAKMRRGVVKQASFAFTIASEELVEELDPSETADGKWDEKWRITEIGHLYDVCACPQGAYAQTESHLRALMGASLGRAGFDPAGHDHRAPAGAGGAIVAPTDEEIVQAEGVKHDQERRASQAQLARLKARAKALTITLT